MENEVKSKWYDNKGTVFLLLFVFFPAGLYALWKNSKFSMISKVVLTAIVIILIVIFSQESPENNHLSTNTTEQPKNVNTEIKASLEDFKISLPLLNQIEMKTTDRTDSVEFSWKNLSTMGQSNWVRFYDDKKDGKLDQISFAVILGTD